MTVAAISRVLEFAQPTYHCCLKPDSNMWPEESMWLSPLEIENGWLMKFLD